MDWVTLHSTAQQRAEAADKVKRENVIPGGATELYASAADFEKQAFEAFLTANNEDKPRTIGILAVSAAALYYKARQYGLLKEFADKVMAEQPLQDFARAQLQELLDWAAAPEAA